MGKELNLDEKSGNPCTINMGWVGLFIFSFIPRHQQSKSPNTYYIHQKKTTFIQLPTIIKPNILNFQTQKTRKIFNEENTSNPNK